MKNKVSFKVNLSYLAFTFITISWLMFLVSCLKSSNYENIISYSKPCWSYDSKKLIYISEGNLWLSEASEFKPKLFYKSREFTGNPIGFHGSDKIAVQRKSEVWIIKLNKKVIENKYKIEENSNWIVDSWKNKIMLRSKNLLWTTTSIKGFIAEVSRSPDYFGENELLINDKKIASERGITWIFSPYGSPLNWSSDGSRLFFISAISGWSKIYSINYDGTDIRQETYGDGDDREFTILSDGTIIFVSNRLSRTEWSLWERNNKNNYQRIFGKGGFVKDVAVSPDEKWVAFQYSTPDKPFEMFVMDYKNKNIFQITKNNFNIKKGMSSSGVIKYWSNNRMIEAILYMPKNFNPSRKHPAIIRIHGGPSMQVSLMWSSLDNFLASNGYIVLAPNYSGSTGYGRKFEESNFYKIGYEDCEDIVAAAEYLKKLPYVRANAIGIIGTSYGGYLTNLVIGKYPDIFSAAVSWYGISDWLSIFDFPKLHPNVKYFFLNRLGNLQENYKLYQIASPINYVTFIKTPILMAHGDNDTVVPVQQSEILYSRMKMLNKNVVLKKYKGEGHGWSSQKVRNDAYKEMIKWFDKYLKN